MARFKNSIRFKMGRKIKLRASDSLSTYEVTAMLVEGEEILSSYIAVRDYVVFTNKRVIAVDVRGVVGKKKNYTSIPYANVQVFSVETAGLGDPDSELDIWVAGVGHIHFDFTSKTNIAAIGKSISECMLV